MRRTKQVQRMVDKANKMLKERMVNFENKYGCDVFVVTSNLLLAAKAYNGFNIYYDKEINGKTVQCLVGNEDIPLELQYVQFY